MRFVANGDCERERIFIFVISLIFILFLILMLDIFCIFDFS